MVDKRKFHVLITSFEGAKICYNKLSRIKWEMLVVDEAHKIKNFQSQISLSLRDYTASFKLLLTGTPLSNNLNELWSLLSFIMPELFVEQDLFD